jgi:hypothetical protein
MEFLKTVLGTSQGSGGAGEKSQQLAGAETVSF